MMNEKLLAAARAAASPEELAALIKESGRDLSAEQAERLFERLHSAQGEIPDEELDSVAGGGCGGGPNWVEPTDSCKFYCCDGCGCGRGQQHAATCSQVKHYATKLDKCFTCSKYEIGGYCTDGH